MITLDHIGIVGRSIHELRGAWQRAGFFVTEPEELMAIDARTGQRTSLGQHSCHIIFERGYIELTAVDPITPQHHLFPWIRGHDALGIIAFGAEDIEAVHQRLAATEPVGALAQASRPIHYGARRGDAFFTWFALGASTTPEALLCFVRNERPELIYQDAVQHHGNGARALDSVIVCAVEPAREAARYATYSGVPPEAVNAGLYRCSLQASCVWIGTAAAIREFFDLAISGGMDDPPRCVGFVVAPLPAMAAVALDW